MGDFTWLPGSIAVDSIDALLADKKFNYTSMAVSDEMALNNAINVRLIELEKTLNIDLDVLQAIIEEWFFDGMRSKSCCCVLIG